MAKEIKCTVCRCKAGEIRDASLLKGLRFICERCDNRRLEINVELMKLQRQQEENPIEQLFRGFGGKGKYGS